MINETAPLVLNSYYTLIAASIVLLIGRALVTRVRILNELNIPEPVVGGLLASGLILILHQVSGFSISIQHGMQEGFMLMFFASIGLSADFSRLRAGGFPLILFTVLVCIFIVLQNVVGISLASMLNLPPLSGLITGSITLVGGHGTAVGWGKVLEDEFHIQGATALALACATFGLVCGGLLGGPVAKRLINKVSTPSSVKIQEKSNLHATFDSPKETRLITPLSAIETLAMFAACLAGASFLTDMMATHFADSNLLIPTFVWALATGVVVRNILSGVFRLAIFDRCVDVFGNVSLSLFLAMALLSLELWTIKDLALPLVIILSVQAITMVLYAYYVVFRCMGADYDAVVLASGFCGFGMGATPTAVANMQAVTSRFGPSYKAFLIVPMVGAFFVDIINASVLSVITSLPFFH